MSDKFKAFRPRIEMMTVGDPAWNLTEDECRGLRTTLDYIAQLEAERDALAAALEETDAAFEKFAAHHGPCCHVHNSTDETAQGECCLCDIDRDARQRGDYAAILAARDARMKREGAREALRGLKASAGECIRVMLFESSGRHDRAVRDSYCEGVENVIADMDAALAALEKEGRNDG